MKGMKGMPGMEMCGDRGFSKLENGMEHGHAFTQPVSDADRATLARQMVLARETALRYPTVAAAEAAGKALFGQGDLADLPASTLGAALRDARSPR